jgi:hypothetical protein
MLSNSNGESESLSDLDDANPGDRGFRVLTLAGVPPEWRNDQAAALVVTQRLDVHAGLARHLADPECPAHRTAPGAAVSAMNANPSSAPFAAHHPVAQ